MTAAVREAIAWFARDRSGAMTAQEAADLHAWLEADPANREAMDEVARAWGRMELSREAPEILALRAGAYRRPVMTRRRAGWALAAGLAVAIAGAGLHQAGVFGWRKYPDQTFRTEVGQRSTVTLPDGSVVTLNTDTVLRTRASGDRRLIYLDRGQAFFRVAKDPAHPFIVHAAGRTVTALGTAFDVRAEQGRFEVTLVEGKVRVETPPPRPGKTPAAPAPVQAVELMPGNQFAAADDSRWSVARADVEQETTWLTGWLKFQDEPLGEVAAEFGRYSNRRIVIADSALAARPITGRFQADDVEAFARALEHYDIARVELDSPAVIRLAPPR